MVYDKNGNPICLYLESNGHQPGPNSAPYLWKVTLWNGFEWLTYNITTSDHNYDMGSLWVDENFEISCTCRHSPPKMGSWR